MRQSLRRGPPRGFSGGGGVNLAGGEGPAAAQDTTGKKRSARAKLGAHRVARSFGNVGSPPARPEGCGEGDVTSKVVDLFCS